MNKRGESEILFYLVMFLIIALVVITGIIMLRAVYNSNLEEVEQLSEICNRKGMTYFDRNTYFNSKYNNIICLDKDGNQQEFNLK